MPKTALGAWSGRYQASLRRYLSHGGSVYLKPALKLGREAVAQGLETLDLARIHAEALPSASSAESDQTRQRRTSRARAFFAETAVPVERTHDAALASNSRIHRLTRTLKRRTVESSTSTRHLKQGITRRQAAEVSLQKSGERHIRLLGTSQRLQDRLRHQTRAILTAQENERHTTSRRLQDEIAQTLLAIHIRLLALKASAKVSRDKLAVEIADTKRLVNQSVKTIRRMALNLGARHAS